MFLMLDYRLHYRSQVLNILLGLFLVTNIRLFLKLLLGLSLVMNSRLVQQSPTIIRLCLQVLFLYN